MSSINVSEATEQVSIDYGRINQTFDSGHDLTFYNNKTDYDEVSNVKVDQSFQKGKMMSLKNRLDF